LKIRLLVVNFFAFVVWSMLHTSMCISAVL